MAEAREVLLKGANEEDPCFLVSTSFEKEELDDVVRMIKEELYTSN